MKKYSDIGYMWPDISRGGIIILFTLITLIMFVFVLTQTGHIKTGPETLLSCYCNGQDSVRTSIYSNGYVYDYIYDCNNDAGTQTIWYAWMDHEQVIHRSGKKPKRISRIDPAQKVKNRHIIRSLDRKYYRDKGDQQCN